jgi:hypothetical protein
MTRRVSKNSSCLIFVQPQNYTAAASVYTYETQISFGFFLFIFSDELLKFICKFTWNWSLDVTSDHELNAFSRNLVFFGGNNPVSTETILRPLEG